jgi:SAM-dependent methyltransferase
LSGASARARVAQDDRTGARMGFSADWLALREPADRAAREVALARKVCATQPAAPVVVDLGAGTGATRRALAGFLPASTEWILVDNDPALLESAAHDGGAKVRTVVADLNDIGALPLDGASLVTASALLDLVSRDWLAALIERLRALRLPIYAALSYDGRMTWTPASNLDPPVVAAFNRHQRGDKGFGPALGPDAAREAARLFREAGFGVEIADSPWRLDAGHAELQRELMEGIAEAACAAGCDAAGPWLKHRLSQLDRATCEVGHADLLALPLPGCDNHAASAMSGKGLAGRPEGTENA